MVQAQQTSFVNPFIGTSDDHGQTDPSATIPFKKKRTKKKKKKILSAVVIDNHNLRFREV